MHLLPPVIQDGNATSMEIPSSGKMWQNMAKNCKIILTLFCLKTGYPQRTCLLDFFVYHKLSHLWMVILGYNPSLDKPKWSIFIDRVPGRTWRSLQVPWTRWWQLKPSLRQRQVMPSSWTFRCSVDVKKMCWCFRMLKLCENAVFDVINIY